MQQDLHAGLDGAIGGVAGTWSMSLCMRVSRRFSLSPKQPLPPERVAHGVLERVGAPLPGGPAREVVELAAHYAFGTTGGTVFGVLYRRLGLPLPGPVQGIIFGLTVWMSSYAGWVPGLGILPPPAQDDDRRAVTIIVGHILYGAVLGAIVDRRARR
jgi:uncharacterized protein DUF6789